MRKNTCGICKTIEKIKNNENPYFVKELQTGYVVIGDNQHFYGYSLCLCKECVSEIYELESAFRQKHLMEMSIVANAVKNAFGADKMNYECLGNGCSHIHWHLYPRRKGDLGEYGNNGKGPVWWLPPHILWSDETIPSKTELYKMKTKLRQELETLLK